MGTRKPFPHLRAEEWLRLALFALGTFYVLHTIWTIYQLGIFSVLGIDFRALLASAQVAKTFGFSQVYHLALQQKAQEALMAPYHSQTIEFPPVLLLPVFVVPFRWLLPLGLSGGFTVWTLLNLAVLIGYLVWFLGVPQGSRGEQTVRSLLALALLSFPIFTNFFFGQTNVWLVVCIGEFLRAWERGKSLRGGLWLGGLLLKPQILVLLIPFLALSGEWRILTGFTVASAVIGAISLILVGPEELWAWATLLTRYTGNLSTTTLPTTNPEVMINFRMLGEVLSVLFRSEAMRGIAAGMSVVVALLALMLSLQLRKRAPEERTPILLPLLTASCTVTWHSPIHTAAVLVPPLLRLVATGQLPRRLFVLWVLLPPAAYLLSMAGIALLTVWGKPPLFPGLTCPALVLLILHLWMMFMTWRSNNSQDASTVHRNPSDEPHPV